MWHVAFGRVVLRRLLSRKLDIFGITLACVALVGCILVWFFPPLLPDARSVAGCRVGNAAPQEAIVYRPVAIPARYYIYLPEKALGKFQWFMVDFRSETAAWLPESPERHTAGIRWIKRAGDKGLDLEFRKMDNTEWLVNFTPSGATFSNSLMAVSLQTQ